MIAIADSGSTKTSWVLADENGKLLNFKTIGFNPYFVTREEVEKSISEAFPCEADAKSVKSVYFYGSGCSECDNFAHLREALQNTFRNAEINIYSDMLGTARAILKHDTGIAGILGTGSNSCFYNGESITQNAISLGYILGDEGSGATIGKMFAKRYLEGRFEEKLTKQILEETGENITTILNAIYSKDHPNRFLASFSLFIKRHIDHPQMRELMQQAFADFFKNYVFIYPNYLDYKIGFCGSIAFNYEEILVEELGKIGYKKENIL
ncbi:MAG: hypothetical protein HUK15_04805, partial [Bacteroidales bacterium]|nr:hypothetical protein [Bacteroidales bacterium]